MALAQMAPERPPFLRFHDMSVEDRAATIEAGHLVLKSQHRVTVRQIGSKDGPEFIVEPWLKQQDDMAALGKLPREWAASYRKQYEAWRAGMEGPVNGFPIREWAAVNRAMAESMFAVGISSVEDLAAANEETLARIGMGARLWQQKARAWLETKSGGISPEDITAMRAEIGNKDERIKALEARLAALESKKPR